MKYLLRLFRSKAASFAIAFALQLLFIYIVLNYLTDKSDFIYKGLTFIAIILCIRVFNRDSDSNSKLLWIFIILLVPFFGAVLYLLFGERHIPRKLMTKTRQSELEYLKYGLKNLDIINSNPNDNMLNKMVNMAWNSGYFSVYENTEMKYFPTGEGQFITLIDELEKAEKFIFIEFFILNKGLMWDSILQILLDKVKQGVDVRMMWDDVGSINYIDKKYAYWLNEQGIKTYVFNPATYSLAIHMNNRDHRKIVIIDGKTAFTGGHNISDEYINAEHRFGYWKDMGCMFRGKAVETFTITFLQLWDFQSGKTTEYHKYIMPEGSFSDYQKNDGYIIPFSDSPTDENYTGKDFHLNMLNNCRDYFWISTPYLILDTEMIDALALAVSNGIDVRIIVPGIPDKKTVYEVTKSNIDLLTRKGIKIYIFEPGFIHGKVCLCDDTSAMVGTVNMDSRSYYLHYECGVWMHKTQCITDIKQDFEDMFEACHLVLPSDVEKTGMLLRIYRSFIRILSPIL